VTVELKFIFSVGYRLVAINTNCCGNEKPKVAHLIPGLSSVVTGKYTKTSKKYAPSMVNALQIQSTDSNCAENGEVKVLKRITLKFEDIASFQTFSNSSAIHSYELVAVEAESARVFQHACEQAEIDIITFDMMNRIPFPIRKPQIDAAIKRSIHFEITYTAALGDSAGRRYFFSNATNLIRLTGGKNLIFSSSATREMLLRSPYDVVNIGILVGLSHGKALDAVSTSCATVIQHAEKRRGLQDVSVILIEQKEDVNMD
jgi:ribonuclease P/MRP protein subunit RPP1